MKKPAHRWETARHVAYPAGERPKGPWADDPRAETLTLDFGEGRVGHATVSPRGQQVDALGASDPDLPHAMRCWLAARGARTLDLRGPDGAALATGPFTLDDLGEPPTGKRGPVITLAPSNAELVEALGRFDRVVACESSSDWPPAVAEVERLGPDLAPDLDRVAALQPAVVVSSLTVPGMERVVTGLRARGLHQVVCAPRSFAEVLQDVDRVGRHLGAEAAAEGVRGRMVEERAALQAAHAGANARVYLEWWPRPMFTPGADCYSNELIELAGGCNVFADRPGSSVQINPGELLAADPDVCFVSWCGVAEDKLDPSNLIQRPGLESLRAARAGRVHVLDERFSGRPGPRMLEAARRMAAAIEGL